MSRGRVNRGRVSRGRVHSGRVHRAVLIALGVVGVLAAGPGYVLWSWSAPSDTATPIEFEVLRGTGVSQVARDLHAHGLVRDPRTFLVLLRLEGLDRRVGEGLYDLHPAMAAREVAAALGRGGRPRTVRVVLPEGSRLVDVAARLEAAGLAPAGATLERLREPTTLTFVRSSSTAATPLAPEAEGEHDAGADPHEPMVDGLEGYLFPASYDIPVREPLDAIVQRFVRRFERELDPATRARLAEEGLDVHAWVTLASMVQAEAANDGEMPIIAGVFRNRLDIGMPLQSDPTVAYGLGKDLPALDFPGGDFEVDHPWNTYTRGGLPVGPIGNPGRAALDAVLAPDRTDADGREWFYFLHGRDDDGPVFRPNLDFEGHLRDVARYLRR